MPTNLPNQNSPTNQTNPSTSLTQPFPISPTLATTSQPLINHFYHFLKGSKQISDSSIKNYVSDINQFFQFIQASQTNPSLIIKPEQITANLVKNYYQYLIDQKLNSTSINRRLSTLRRFGEFLTVTNLTNYNPTSGLTNINPVPSLGQILNDYCQYLKDEGLSKSTINNYLSDLKGYILWAQKNIKTTDGDIN